MGHTVLIVEDDLRLRASLAQAVLGAVDLKLVGEADDLPEGLRLLDAMQPDVLLVDIGLPSGSGLELIRHAAKRSPQCNVMVITVFAEEQLVVDCIEAGATGYLLKGSSHQDIAAQIRLLVAGGSPISPPTARPLLGRFTARRPPDAPPLCSPPLGALHAQPQLEREFAEPVDARARSAVDERQGLQLRRDSAAAEIVAPHRRDLCEAHLPQAAGSFQDGCGLRSAQAWVGR